MREKLNFFLFLLAILAAGGGDLSGQPSGLRFRAGLGYDYFSQEFFNDSLAAAGADSAAVYTAIKTTYLDDLKALLEARWTDTRRVVDLRSTFEQTPDLLRLKFQSNLRPKWERFKLDWNAQLSGQTRYHDSATAGDEYILGQTRAKLTYALNPTRSIFGQVRADAVGFGEQSTYIYNYHREGGSLGIVQTFANFSALTAELFYLHRGVTDSAELNYDSYGLQTSYFGEIGSGQVDLTGRVESRDLKEPGGLGDFLRFDFYGRSRWSLGGWWNGIQEVTFEAANYRGAEQFFSDYYRIQASLLAGVEQGSLEFDFGPVVDRFDERGTGVVAAADYLEAGVKGVLQYQKLGGAFVSLEPVLARRNVKNETEFQSNFTALRLTLIGDLDIWRRLTFNFLGSAEWEWYGDSGQNNRVFLVSGGMTYGF